MNGVTPTDQNETNRRPPRVPRGYSHTFTLVTFGPPLNVGKGPSFRLSGARYTFFVHPTLSLPTRSDRRHTLGALRGTFLFTSGDVRLHGRPDSGGPQEVPAISHDDVRGRLTDTRTGGGKSTRGFCGTICKRRIKHNTTTVDVRVMVEGLSKRGTDD